jgi:methylated-DNA-[protein]-cysteine S-methyltransferase
MTPGARRIVETPLGRMLLRAQGGALTGAWFLDQADCPPGAEDDADADRQASRDRNGQAPREGDGSASRDTPCLSSPPTRRAMPSDEDGGAASPDRQPEEAVLDRAALELAEYFEGRRRAFSLAMATQGTPFQRRVWDALRDVPFGTLESYGALAGRCAQAAAVRAVAQAVGRNPISIFIPCHRIVGSNSALTGFGGGLARKQALLALEGHVYATPAPDARRATADARQGTLW